MLAQEEARELLDSLDTSTVVGLGNLEPYLDAYISAAGIAEDCKG